MGNAHTRQYRGSVVADQARMRDNVLLRKLVLHELQRDVGCGVLNLSATVRVLTSSIFELSMSALEPNSFAMFGSLPFSRA